MKRECFRKWQVYDNGMGVTMCMTTHKKEMFDCIPKLCGSQWGWKFQACLGKGVGI